jgi:decaprenyl-phosphate phosphoribosyltransferase
MSVATTTSSVGPWIRLLRPRQWAKNLLVFAAPLGAGVLLDRAVLLLAVGAFVAFSAAAAATYAVNDIADVDRDRSHPTKSRRPLAAGEIPVAAAAVVAALLAAAALAMGAVVSTRLMVVIAIYLGAMLLYSTLLKHLPVVDLVIVAAGFVLRGIAGGVAVDVPLSSWFLLVTSFGALYVVAGKRYAELTNLVGNGAGHRPSLDGYSDVYLRHVLTLGAGLAAIAYCLWAFEVPRTGASQMLMQLSIVPFVTALLRYSQVVMGGGGGEPEEIFLRDRVLLTLAVLWIGLFGIGVSLG